MLLCELTFSFQFCPVKKLEVSVERITLGKYNVPLASSTNFLTWNSHIDDCLYCAPGMAHNQTHFWSLDLRASCGGWSVDHKTTQWTLQFATGGLSFSPWKLRLKWLHAASLNLVTSMVWQRSLCVVNVAFPPLNACMAAIMSSRSLIWPAGISLLWYSRSQSSNSAWDAYGNQLLGPLSVSQLGGGVPSGMGSPCSSHGIYVGVIR